ncbi:MAG: Rad52/Rad22 family DNA repair protein [Pseudomonadota bacterium]
MTAEAPPASQGHPDVDQLLKSLAAPFEATEVKFKPGVISGNRCLALHYVDARVVQDRLDDVMGPANWQAAFRELPEGSVVCRLSLRLGSEWVPKEDVGGPSEQPDGGDRMKAAFSDALKRAAVQWGIGRYLYRIPSQWVDYDPQKRQIKKPPQLPDCALPARTTAKRAAPAPQRQPGEDQDAECIDQPRQDELRRLLDAKDKTVEGAVQWLGLSADTTLADLTVAEYERLREALSPKPHRAPQHREPAPATK